MNNRIFIGLNPFFIRSIVQTMSRVFPTIIYLS